MPDNIEAQEGNEEVVEQVVQSTEDNNNNSPEGDQYSDVELKAIEMGWRPKEDFNGDDADFIPADEYVRRRPLFDRIDSVTRELRDTRKAVKLLQEHHEKVREVEYRRAMEQLRANKKAALESGDADRLIEIDDQMATVKAQEVVNQQQAKQQAQQVHPGFAAWVDKNRWYQSDTEMRSTADQIGTAYAVSHPDLSPDEVLAYVEGRIRKVYPEKFANPNKSRPSAVEGSSTAPTRNSGTRDTFTLTEEEKRAMNTFIRQGILTKEQYIADIKSLRGVA